MEMYIGMDVHCKSTVFVAQDKDGKVTAQGRVPTTLEGFIRMLDETGAPPGTQIGMETGNQAWWVSRVLSSLGMSPVVIDAREVRAKARRINQKSDKRDAFEICDGLRRGIYTCIVYVPPDEIQRLRVILSRRRHFVSLCTSQVNAAKFLLRSEGLTHCAGKLNTWQAWERLLSKPEVAALRPYLMMHAEVWKVAKQQVEALEKELKEALKPFSREVEILTTVPGVGLITAATFIATIGDPRRFPSSGHVVSYIGLAPATYNSGEKERYGHITKRGSAELRAMLCEAAHHASNPKHPLNPYFVRALSKGGYKKAVVAVAQRLARILYQMHKKGEVFDEAKLNVVRVNELRTRRVYYKLRKQAA
jgi:transposase